MMNTSDDAGRSRPGRRGPRRRVPSAAGAARPASSAAGAARPVSDGPVIDRPRRPAPDPARRVAFDLLQAVGQRDAYANLVLPGLLRERGLTGRDAALATELGYGTVRSRGTLDAIIAACSSRAPAELDSGVLDVVRLGAYQLLRTRIPPHAAVSATVDLARSTGSGRAAGLVNAVLRRVAERDWDAWADRVADPPTDLGRLAAKYAHPTWIAEAFTAALGPAAAGELESALAADDARPDTHLVARPGRIQAAELIADAPGAEAGPYSPFAVRMRGGDPAALAAVRDGRAGVQDEGSQLCAIAVATVPVAGRDEQWLDLCAGPGGKAALLAALAAGRGARLTANELREHRAVLVRQATAFWDVPVLVGDAADVPGRGSGGDDGWDRILLDAPCTGLGALRRRPEARWRRKAGDVRELAALQSRLLDAAARLVRPGGVIGYVTCSPHLGETVDVVAAAISRLGLEPVDARPQFPGVPHLGDGPAVQLWPHRQGTDAMFCALLRRP